VSSGIFLRFIYVYFLDRKPVYVGSAKDVIKRDHYHCAVLDLPIERLIAKHGRDAFTLQIVEAFRAETKDEIWRISNARENHWMDVLGTWHKYGGYNYMRAAIEHDRDVWLAATTSANRKLAKDPKWLAKNKAISGVTNKKLAQDPNWLAATAAANRKLAQTPEWKAAHRKARDEYKNRKAFARRTAGPPPSHIAPQVIRRKSGMQTLKAKRESAARCKMLTQSAEWLAKIGPAQRLRGAKQRLARSLGMLPYPIRWLESYEPRVAALTNP
jgi:hypothetical protein